MPRKETKDLGVRLTGDVKDLRRKLTGLERDYERHARKVQGINKRMARGRASMGGVAAGRGGAGGINKSIIAGGAAIAGSLGLLQAARETKMFEESLVDLAVTGQKGRSWIAKTRSDVLKLSEQWTKSPEDIVSGLQAIVAATGDADLATKSVGMLTKAAFASGAGVDELAKVANDLMGMLKIKPDGLTGVLDNLFQQANLGAVEIKDMAQWFPVVLADLENFGWAGPEAAKGIGAFFQVAKRGNTNARNTAESIKIFTQMIAQNREKLEKLLDVKLKKDGAWLKLPDLLKTIGQGYVDMEKKGKKGLQGKFGLLVGQGKRAINPVIAAARAGFGNKVGSQSSFNELLNPTGAVGSVNRMAEARKNLSPIFKWNQAMAKLGADMKRHMLPMLIRFSRIMPTIAKAAKFAMDNSEQLFALWAGAKAAKFFSRLMGAGRAAGAGGAGGTAGSGGGGGGIGGSGRGLIRAGGKGLAVAGALGLGRGAFGGGMAERGLDAAATMAALAGGPVGAAIGGAYFITKAAVSIANSEFTGTLDFDKEQSDVRGASLSEDLALRLARVTPGGKPGAKPVSPAEQAAADKKATRLAELQKEQEKVFGGKGGAGLLKRLKSEAEKPEAEKLREAFAGMGGKFAVDEDLIGEASRSEAISEQVKQQIAQIEEMKMLRKSLNKLAVQGVNARISPASAKVLATASATALRGASLKQPSTGKR